MLERRLLALILMLFIALGTVYALVTPAFEASDELWHYPMVRHLADGNPLPVQVFDPALAGPWNQEASQPPLYYYVAAALTFWIDTADMETVRWLNPHVDNGVITLDGNTNLAIHDPAADPWAGTLLAVRLVRLFSVLMGAVTVYLTYKIAREAAPDRPVVALGAASLNAFLPMFLFISGAVNNDNLAIPLASLALLIMIRVVHSRRAIYRPVPWTTWAGLGVVIGLAVLTKEGTLGLLPMAFGTAVVAVWQWVVRHDRSSGTPPPASWIVPAAGRLVWALFLVIVPVLLIAGWWYYRNIVLYGDWLGWNAFIAVLGERAHPASLLQLWGERRGFMMSYWGLFGGVNIPYPMWVYTLLNTVLLASVAGFGVYAVTLLRREWVLWREMVTDWFARLLAAVERNFALIVCLVFSAAVVYGLIQWATTTWSSQGRLVFTAISPLATLMALGLAGWLPERPARAVMGGVAAFLFAAAVAAPFLVITPAYEVAEESLQRPLPADTTFGDALRLTAYEMEPETAAPGDGVWVRLQWDVLQEMDRDWSVFVHLNDPVLGQPIAQRDMYPGQGLLATRLLEPGSQLVDSIYLTLPETAVAPAQLELAVGLYDFETGERLPTDSPGSAALLGRLALQGANGPVPNPVSIFFEHGLELVGFLVEPRRTTAGETIMATTYWRPSEPLPEDYTFFGQVVGADTTRYASSDLTPELATSRWTPGQTYPVTMPLALDPATPADNYPLIVGMYVQDNEGSFNRLQLVTDDGRLTDDFLTLTRVRVD